MKIVNLEWKTTNDGETWTLTGFVLGSDNQFRLRKLFDVMYMGRTQVAFGGAYMRWRVQDRRFWVKYPEAIPEFAHIYEAKAWVDAVVRLET
jgi:hypothetical protein